MKAEDILIIAAATMLGLAFSVHAMVEECPSSCSPVNNNYGPACGSIARPSGETYWSFANLCELFKHRCFNQRFGGPAIEFVSDGSCSSSLRKTNKCQVICSPENNQFGSVCASVGDSFRTYPNLCMLLREQCTNDRYGGPRIKYVKDGSCSIPVRNNELDVTPQLNEPGLRQELEQTVEDP